MPFEKGHNLATGRPKGTANKTTQEVRDILVDVLDGEKGNIKASLKKVRADDDFKYLTILEKWMGFVVPKRKDITSGDEKIDSSVNIIVDNDEQREKLNGTIDGIKAD